MIKEPLVNTVTGKQKKKNLLSVCLGKYNIVNRWNGFLVLTVVLYILYFSQ